MAKKQTAPKPTKNRAAQALGRLGGAANTTAQQKARRKNGTLGGRPRRVCTRCGEPVLGGGVHKDRALDASCGGRFWKWQKRSERE
jgi:hypothetical protein